MTLQHATTDVESATRSASRSASSPVVLISHKEDHATGVAFLGAMLARHRPVTSIEITGDDSMEATLAAALNEVDGLATVIAVGRASSDAVRRSALSSSNCSGVVLIDAQIVDEAPLDLGLPILVLGPGTRLGDLKETLRDRPARVLSLIEDFIDGVPRASVPSRSAQQRPAHQSIPSQAQAPHIDATAVTVVDTVIVGAGFAGLGAGIRLARRGETSFVILERASDVGGTWRDNVYPGVACDIPSHLYSFSFLPKPDWSNFFAGGAEIHEYLRDAARQEGLAAHLRLNSDVLEMRWQATEQRWSVRTSTGDFLARTLIVAAGRLSDSRVPAIPGLESFPGEVMHSSAWDETVELRGRRVGVVGTGASAAQIIPHLAETAEHVVVFQRSAPYVVPRPDRAYTTEEQLDFELDPDAREAMRDELFWGAETAFAERMRVPGFIDRLRGRALGHLGAQLADPELRAAATPDYEIGCKRVIISNDYYPALASPAVTLEPSALASIDGRAAVAESGAEYDLDVVVFATGFESTRPPFAERTVGADGTSLAEAWRTGMRAHASTTVHGFPNLFVLDGPNASLGHNSAVAMIEAQLDYVLAALDYRASAEVDVLDVSLEAQDAYVDEIDAKAASSVWLTGGCVSWYVDERSGRLTLLWPDFAYAFQRRLGRFDAENYVAL